MFFVLLLFFYAKANIYNEVVRGGYDLQNTRDFPSIINKNNVHKLVLDGNITLCEKLKLISQDFRSKNSPNSTFCIEKYM